MLIRIIILKNFVFIEKIDKNRYCMYSHAHDDVHVYKCNVSLTRVLCVLFTKEMILVN